MRSDAGGAAVALRRLTNEQVALRRVAKIAAEGASVSDLFAAAAGEIVQALDVPLISIDRFDAGPVSTVVASLNAPGLEPGNSWSIDGPSLSAAVLDTGQPARIDDYTGLEGAIAASARDAGITSAAGAPIRVEGAVWGMIWVGTTGNDPLPSGIEDRLVNFTELVGIAVANAESRDRRRSLDEQEAALRRVATLVAEGATPDSLYAAVLAEVVLVLATPSAWLLRYEPERAMTVLAAVNDRFFPVGSRWPLDGTSVTSTIFDTGRPAHIDDFTGLEGAIAARTRDSGHVSSLGVPIIVDGAVWGAICVGTQAREPLPPETEERLGRFTELLATAVANADTRTQLRRVADEQAALRRVATLVASESSAAEVFAAVTEEAWRVLEPEAVGLLRFEPDGAATLLAQSETPWDPPPLGTRFPLDGDNLVVQVHRTAEAARVDDWADSTGSVAAMATVLGVRSAVATPIVVEGRLWGTLIAVTSQREPLPADTESRIDKFCGLVATALANAEARGDLSRLVAEQEALRRIAVLVAQQPSSEEVFTAVTGAVGPLVGADLAAMHVFGDDGAARVIAGWSETGPMLAIGTRLPLDGDSAVARVFQTGAAARIDSYVDVTGKTAQVARDLHLRSTVGAPILVEGKLWGALMAATRGDEPLRDDAETRIAAFTELVATAVSNAQARAHVQRLADEQAALRRVATLIAAGTGPEEVFPAVAAEVSGLFGSDVSAIVRFEDDGMATVLGDVGGPHMAGKRVTLDPGYVVHQVRETGRSARYDTDDPSAADADSLARTLGIQSAVASPIVVEGEVWGAITAASQEGRLTPNAERRLTEFTELVATAVANTQAREQVTTLAAEQAALRRVATLVARGAPPAKVFEAVAGEVGELLGADGTVLGRYDGDGASTAIGSWSSSPETIPTGTRSTLGGRNVLTMVHETAKPARLDSYEDATGASATVANRFGWRASIAAPIIVEGRVWGVMLVATQREEPFPAGAEERLAAFTELVGTAVANAQAHVALRDFADEQASLRRVATLVAGTPAPAELFAAVTEEIGLVLGADATLLGRVEPDGSVVVVGTWAEAAPVLGTRFQRGGTNLTTIVLDTGRPARIDSYDDASGQPAHVARSEGLRSAVGAPIHVEGRVWGLVIAGTTRDEPLPQDAEQRLARFSELVATAVANAAARSDLIASRARLVAAGDEARRRIERDLHDGTQQRLLALGLDLQRLRAALPDDEVEVRSGLEHAERSLESAVEEVRELSRGLHPAQLSRLGLEPALRALVRRCPLLVDLSVDVRERPAEAIETAVYYVVSEALTNAIKHAHASSVAVAVARDGDRVAARITDDGDGGAEAELGSGLTGLRDRVDALGGRFTLVSAPGHGTTVSVGLPAVPPPTR